MGRVENKEMLKMKTTGQKLRNPFRHTYAVLFLVEERSLCLA